MAQIISRAKQRTDRIREILIAGHGKDARKTWNVRVAMQLGQVKRKEEYST